MIVSSNFHISSRLPRRGNRPAATPRQKLWKAPSATSSSSATRRFHHPVSSSPAEQFLVTVFPDLLGCDLVAVSKLLDPMGDLAVHRSTVLPFPSQQLKSSPSVPISPRVPTSPSVPIARPPTTFSVPDFVQSRVSVEQEPEAESCQRHFIARKRPRRRFVPCPNGHTSKAPYPRWRPIDSNSGLHFREILLSRAGSRSVLTMTGKGEDQRTSKSQTRTVERRSDEGQNPKFPARWSEFSGPSRATTVVSRPLDAGGPGYCSRSDNGPGNTLLAKTAIATGCRTGSGKINPLSAT